MDLLIGAFNIILYRPLLNTLILLYEYLPGRDFGVAVIVLTILIKVLLYPLGVKAIKSQKTLSELQPKIKEIQEKHRDNREEQTKAIMGLYRKEKINPFSGFLPLLIQFPILIALFWIFKQGFQSEQLSFLYSFIPHPESINPSFLGIIDLSRSYFIEIEENVRHYLWPNIVLIVSVGVAQFFQTKISMPQTKPVKNKDAGFAGQMQKQMRYFMPAFMILILLNLPTAVALYWLTTTLFTISQQYCILKKKND